MMLRSSSSLITSYSSYAHHLQIGIVDASQWALRVRYMPSIGPIFEPMFMRIPTMSIESLVLVPLMKRSLVGRHEGSSILGSGAARPGVTCEVAWEIPTARCTPFDDLTHVAGRADDGNPIPPTSPRRGPSGPAGPDATANREAMMPLTE